MKVFLILIPLLFSVSLSAALPTAEGLFRNPNNKELTGGVIVLKLMVEEAKPIIETKVSEIETAPEGAGQPMPPRYYKLIFSVEEDERVKLLQIEYRDGKMAREDLVNMVFLPELEKTISEETDVEKSLFYSLMLMLGLNKSESISEFLSRYGNEFKKNTEILNQEKLKLLEEYKNFLTVTDDEKELAEELESPLRPVDEEKRETVDTVMKQKMYQPSERVRLIRENGRFFWRVNLDSIIADFTNEEHRISRLSLNHTTGSIETNYGDYVIFDGVHELPKIMIFKNMAGKSFKLRMLDLDHLTNKRGVKMDRRAEIYQKNLDKVKKRATDPAAFERQPIFLY